jgi:uncharacterized OB-fold protein
MNIVSPSKISPPEASLFSLPGDALAADATGRPVLIGGICRSCGSRMFPFAAVCSTCMSEEIAREPLPREGTLYSFTIVHVGPKAWEKPYALGYIDLDNGVRVFSHLRGAAFEIAQRVELSTAEIGKNAECLSIETYVFQPLKA